MTIVNDMSSLTQDLLRSIFRYDKEEGKLYWKISRSKCIKEGDEAGMLTGAGYRRVYISDRLYMVYRVIWLMYHGEVPKGQIDHINGVRNDNHIDNLRVVSHSENQRNASIRKDNNTGTTGVFRSSRGSSFEVRISVEGKQKHIGTFASLEEAINITTTKIMVRRV